MIHCDMREIWKEQSHVTIINVTFLFSSSKRTSLYNSHFQDSCYILFINIIYNISMNIIKISSLASIELITSTDSVYFEICDMMRVYSSKYLGSRAKSLILNVY